MQHLSMMVGRLLSLVAVILVVLAVVGTSPQTDLLFVIFLVYAALMVLCIIAMLGNDPATNIRQGIMALVVHGFLAFLIIQTGQGLLGFGLFFAALITVQA